MIARIVGKSKKLAFSGRVGWGLLLVLPGLGGCFQALESNADSVPPPQQGDSTKDGRPRFTGPVPDLPPPFTDADIAQAEASTPCPYGSALCSELCGSPDCALDDNSIPGLTVTPTITLPDGGTTTNPCYQIEQESLLIRAQSCSQCHGENGSKMVYTWVMNDNDLASKPVGVLSSLVVPGNPGASELYKRMAAGLNFTDPYLLAANSPLATPGPYGMPPAPGGRQAAGPPEAQASIVTPTSQDVSVIYEWILNCMPGAPDGGASQLPVGDDAAAPTGTSTGTPDAGAASGPVDAGRG